ncbi:exodeoxyribonuclease VII small subunit [Alkalihalobacterium chitinilyticum]|uniref:Exodeoxyribonuclease 7 small subunit n=1 Tax=Alkalihalobacterium chitinilyticum TaxID=2980103 RepID=A0ABT5VBZ8_9BACI|nr:exodeoxyribonuclease VII small subunit [Alkalihalobacterium chitinilyticum]MDE5412242.1 exodeoxyribonuclease VII small subunit [Alkalihalobacterium chitinilyticum]
MSEQNREELSFEDAITELESVVEKLEQGDVPLEEAISMFQQGMNLSKLCHDKLTVVEKQLEQILTEDGQLEEASFQEDQAE